MQSTAYLVLKSLHIIAVISWMAGILYLFRLFVYHTEETENLVKKRLHVMEYRLYRFITIPAMVASVVFGLCLIGLVPQLLAAPWLHAKLLFVAILVGMTLYGGSTIDALESGSCRVSSRTFRFLNEVPTLLMVLIVFFVVLKPFVKG